MEPLLLLLVVLVVVLAAVLVAWWVRRRYIDPKKAQPCSEAFDLVRRRHDLALVRIVQNYQPAHSGTKAWVRRIESGRTQDAWFAEQQRYPEGQYLVIEPHSGYGPHNHDADVLYVERRHVVRRVPLDASRAADRLGLVPQPRDGSAS